MNKQEKSLGLKKQWYKRSRKGDYSGLDTWKGWRKKDYQWFGHVERMEEKRLPNASLHGYVEGKRRRGRQRNTWMDNVREDPKEKNIDLTRIGEATRSREVRRNLVRASSSAR